MSKTWAYGDCVIEEGAKPHEEEYKTDYYQYFFIVKRGEDRVFKYCVWVEEDAVLKDKAYAEERVRTGHKIPEAVYQQAVAAVLAKIDTSDYSDRLLRLSGDGIEEIDLDSSGAKVE